MSLDSNLKKNQKLVEYENNWITSMGGSFPGERVIFRGKDLFTDLSKLTWMQVLLYGITGREFSEKQSKLFEGIWIISASYPDPRIWNNRIASLGGTVKTSGNLSIAAAIAASEAKYYGQRPLIQAIDFLLDCKKRLIAGEELANIVFSELKKKRILAGFGRPIVNKDERIIPLMDFAKSLNFGEGEYVKLVFKIESLLQKSKYRFTMNAAGLDAALAADQGLSPQEFYHFMTLCFTAGFFPCYIDSNQRSVGVFFPLRCDRISYDGVNTRSW